MTSTTFRLGGAGGIAVFATGYSDRTLTTVQLKSDDGNVNFTFKLSDVDAVKMCRDVILAADLTGSDGKYLLNLCKQAYANRAMS